MQQPARREAAIGPTRPEWKVCSIFTPEFVARLRDDQVRRASKARRTDQNGSRFNPTSSAWAPPTLPTQRFPQDVTSRSR